VRLRCVWVGVCLVFAVAACGGGDLSLAEYNEQGMALVSVMEERLNTLDAEWDSQPATVESARTYWEHRMEAYATAIEGLQGLDPPGEAAELHRKGMELFSKFVAAEGALAVLVASFETATGPEQWWDTAEGTAVGAVEEEIYSFCLGFQAMYDATIERIVLSDVPWIPSEMKEIVKVDIGCETVRSDH
jgi:hypothetical protein